MEILNRRIWEMCPKDGGGSSRALPISRRLGGLVDSLLTTKQWL